MFWEQVVEKAEPRKEGLHAVIWLWQPAHSMLNGIRKGTSCPGVNNTKSSSSRALADSRGTDRGYAILGVLEKGDVS